MSTGWTQGVMGHLRTGSSKARRPGGCPSPRTEPATVKKWGGPKKAERTRGPFSVTAEEQGPASQPQARV